MVLRIATRLTPPGANAPAPAFATGAEDPRRGARQPAESGRSPWISAPLILDAYDGVRSNERAPVTVFLIRIGKGLEGRAWGLARWGDEDAVANLRLSVRPAVLGKPRGAPRDRRWPQAGPRPSATPCSARAGGRRDR
jgi:hypothetical protein